MELKTTAVLETERSCGAHAVICAFVQSYEIRSKMYLYFTHDSSVF